jgi:hypothetical protein
MTKLRVTLGIGLVPLINLIGCAGPTRPPTPPSLRTDLASSTSASFACPATPTFTVTDEVAGSGQ